MAAASKTQFILVLQPLPRINGIRALRFALKVLLRRFGLRCVSARELKGDQT
jgi:hypothetical protein